MRKTTLLTCSLLLASALFAQTLTVTVSPGGLSSAVQTEKTKPITDLAINGTIDQSDLDFVRQKLTSLSSLSLKNASLSGKENSSLPANALKNAQIEKIVLPDGLKTIGMAALAECNKLAYCDLPASLVTIGSGAFENCVLLKSLQCPPALSSIAGYAFIGCSGLSTVQFTEGIDSLGEYAFGMCSGLRVVELPASISFIGKYAFSDCSQLSSITIKSKLTTLDDGLFLGCFNLKTIELPQTLRTINRLAFYGCDGLSTIRLASPTPPLVSDDSLEGVNTSTCVVKVPQGAKAAYAKDTGWSVFKNIVEE